MTDHDDGRTGRQSAHLARHLDERHPGTVLLLARYAPGGRSDVIAATVTGVEADRLTVAATVPDGDAVLRLPLPPGPDLRGRIASLIRLTRAGLPDSVPLTSLEEQLAGGGRSPGDSGSHGRSTGGSGPGDIPS